MTFDLKEDAETIAFELSIQEKRVEEIMTYMCNVGLFENSNSMITCLKLAERIDKSMTNSPRMRSWLKTKSVMTTSDNVMTLHDSVSTCPELEVELEKEKEKEYKKPTTRAKRKFSDWDLEFAKFAYETLLVKNPNFKKPNFEVWANECRMMREIDNRSQDDMCIVWQWARDDAFWQANILSIKKFRGKYDQLLAKKNAPVSSTGYLTANEKAAQRAAQTRKMDTMDDLDF